MSAEPSQRLSRRAFSILFGVSLVTAVGNTGLSSVLPAIGRSLGIKDAMVAGIFALSAVAWAAVSPFWARASDRYGRKPLILLGLIGFVVSMALCGGVVSAGLHHLAPPLTIFIMLLLCRSLFGIFGSASNPATQAYVAEHTSRDQRTQAMSSLAGAFGLGTVIGPFLAPLFVLPFLGLAGPLYIFALIAAAMGVVVIRYLPESKFVREAADRTAGRLPRGGGSPIWKDPRVTPFLIYGFLVAMVQTGQSQTLGFLIIDKLKISPMAAQGFIAVAMMFGAMAGLLAQWGVIRMFEMTPTQLLRWGVAVAAVGSLMVAFSGNYWVAVMGNAIASLGFGLARPGFTAGASLAVGLEEQARTAGAIAAVNGINAAFAPLFVALYEASAPAPFVLNAVILAGLFVYVFRNRMLRTIGAEPATQKDAVLAGLEKSDEGGV